MKENVLVGDIDKMHKNPIAELVQAACAFNSHIEIISEGKSINAKSLMGIMAFGLKPGIEVVISAEGDDESQAVESIKKFLAC
ncbi:MAG: HPr family phosphocarrier protein [Lachnospira sp.]|uniref:Phosphocarrier protein HPr n=1 Tax=Lachnospira pectinoschiza TaxID=28052 RepID=A0A1G9UA51_9FIRM|nr:HPr family phosphocarrier protein [Lachnospira pectinoschiza]MCR5515519.1 HPr family phosphocarrier protein [Lachnospira sp.]SDM56604.1 phosphocarrier protein [Lachnospira pectinoschiza]